MRPRITAGPRRAFTLLELLAVIVIIGILAAVLVSQLGGADDAAKASSTEGFLAKVEAVLDTYYNDHGEYPPSRFTPEQGVPNEGVNVGVEALIVALYSKGYEAAGLELDEERLANTDGDMSARRLTDFGNRKLLEFVDLWGNPIAYLHRTEYGQETATYLTIDEDGQEQRVVPKARRNRTTGRYHNQRSFQLISAGSDGVFGTEDDLYNFEPERE